MVTLDELFPTLGDKKSRTSREKDDENREIPETPEVDSENGVNFKDEELQSQQTSAQPKVFSEKDRCKENNKKVNVEISERVAALLSSNPSLPKQSLSELNKKATELCKYKDFIGSVAVFRILFSRAAQLNLTHPELYICHSNCSAAYLELHLYEEALEHAGHCARLAEASLRRNHNGSASYIKSFARKGAALLALGRHREAVSTFEKGLSMDPFNPDLKLGLERANQGVLEDLIQGKGHEHRSITYPEPSQRISYHAYSAPLHKVRTEDMLPIRLLTPFQAENDHNIKDTYNYMTVQADIRMPGRLFRQLEDDNYNQAWKQAIYGAIQEIESTDTDCRVLNMGSGVGVQAVHAVEAGARHVTATDRWLYLALSTKETLVANNADEEKYCVVYKRPTDLKIKDDVPVCCNLLIANILDEGLLSTGIIPAVRYALESGLLTHEAVVMPASATVYVQAIEQRTTDVCGLDMSAANLYRWHPSYSTGPAPIDMDAVRTLSKPVPVWYFDFKSPPDKSDVKMVDVEFTHDGRFNAVMFWYDLHLWGDIHLTSAPLYSSVNGKEEQNVERHVNQYLQPALQYLAGELRVDAGTIMPIIASHNTVGMRFDIETADYLHLMKPDASFPHRHFSMLADTSRLQAFDRAITRLISRKKQKNEESHVLDMGTGSGVLALMAARAGASSVVACDLHPSLCDVTRKAAAANKLASKISVVNRDVALLQRGREIRPLGVDIIVADMFDSGLTGDQFPHLLDLTRKNVIQPGATVIPCAATMYCMGIEALSSSVTGVNVAQFNKYRWNAEYTAVHLSDIPHKVLTKPVKVSEMFFDGEKRPRMRDGLIKFETVADGVLNAVIFWFDLHLDEVESITSAPVGYGLHGSTEPNANEDNDRKEHYWGQALQYLDRSVSIEANKKLSLLVKREGSKTRVSLRPGVGEWVDRAPWKIEWGGGASVENPHFQRVHYCELLVRDFLMRCKSQRFPSIEKDINMVLAHCGSLFLDPAALEEAGHELVVLEKLHTRPEFSPGASLEALTRPPLRRY